MPFSAPFWSPSQASAILFDWDGVIAETRLDFSGVREKYYGGRRAMLLEDAVTLPPEQRKALMRDLEKIEMDGAYHPTPVPGILDILHWVQEKKIPWAVVSRNCRQSILIAAEQTGVQLPELVRSRDDGDCVKPDPRALSESCAALGVPASQTLFIGDFIYDMIGARRAGMRGVLVRKAIEADWEQWLECRYSTMPELYRQLLAPTAMIPWEYQETVRKNGRDFLQAAHSAKLRVPAQPPLELGVWIARAAALGVGTFVVSKDAIFSPVLWKQNPTLEPSDMGKPIADALCNFLSVRYPFAAVSTNDDDSVLTPPHCPDELEEFLSSLS